MPGLGVLSAGQCGTAVGLKRSCQDAGFLSLPLHLCHCLSRTAPLRQLEGGTRTAKDGDRY